MKDAAGAPRAAEMLKITAKSALEFGVIDGIIAEPSGGAHRNLAMTAERIKAQVMSALRELGVKSPIQIRDERFEKYLHMGSVLEH